MDKYEKGSVKGYDMAKKSYKDNSSHGMETPMGAEHYAKKGNKSGDKGYSKEHKPSETGSSLGMGLSERSTITEYPEDLGQGRDIYSGKPYGPEKRSIGRGQRFG